MKGPFPYYIEDWILWMAKLKDSTGADIKFGYYAGYPVRLANYDVTFVNQSSTLISKGQGLTDRQVDMAVKIITKYRKQILRKISVDPSYLADSKPLRLPIRAVNRSFEVLSEPTTNQYHVRFPYMPDKVTVMHDLKTQAGGEFAWNKAERRWEVDRTERNLALIASFVNRNNPASWYYDAETMSHMREIETSLLHPELSLPTLAWDNGVTLVNSNPWIDAALARDEFDIATSAANTLVRAQKYGLAVAPSLATQARIRYPNIADVLLSTQEEVVEQGKTFSSKNNADGIVELMNTVDARKWIFLSFYAGANKPMSQVVDAAVLTETAGEKIFFTANRDRVTSSAFMTELLNSDLTDSIIISDTSVNLSSGRKLVEFLSRPILKMIHVFG